MRKRIIFRMVLLIIVIAVSFGGAFYVKGQMTYDHVEEVLKKSNTVIGNMTFRYETLEEEKSNVDTGMYDFSIHTFDELEEKTECIVLATKEYTSSSNGTVLTKFKIEDVLKGEMDNEDYFYMFESVYFEKRSSNAYRVVTYNGWYLPTITGTTYLLYINRVDGYKDRPIYIMTSNIFSKLPIQDGKITCFWENGVTSFHLDEMSQYIARFPNQAMSESEENLQLAKYYQEYIEIAKKANLKYLNQDIEIVVEDHRIY